MLRFILAREPGSHSARRRRGAVAPLLAFLLGQFTWSPAMGSDRGAGLLNDIQRGAARFFWENAHPVTGMVKDRARNHGKDRYDVSSIASTGYALAALPIAVERGWTASDAARKRAVKTLRYIADELPHRRGWYFHFIDWGTGKRVWKSEVSTIDTSLLVLGALACGQYFGGEAERLASRIYDRMDWNWVLTNEGSQPGKLLVSHGFRPEEGFLKNDWGSYCEAPLLYLLGLGARRNPLPPASWDGWERGRFEYGGETSFSGGPIFMHQMPHGWFPLKGMRDRLGCDYWQSSLAATRIHRKYCADREGFRAGYGRNGWGLNACDGPKGYMAYGVPGPEDGTLSPTGAVSSILFEPRQSLAAAEEMRKRFGRRIWGRYGFANAYNLDRDWFDPDVIGIDLGMAMLAIENHRTGLVWRLIRSHPFCARAYRAAGLRREGGAYPRQLRAAARPISPAGQPPAPSPSRP